MIRQTWAFALAAAAALTGCKTMPTGAQLVDEGVVAIGKAPLCCGASLATAKRLTLPAEPATIEINATLQAFNFGGNKAFFLLYELPPFSQPYSIAFTSSASGQLNDAAIFVPRVALYDAQFNVVRYFDEKTLRNRGNDLERTVFINPDNKAERYLAVYGSDLSASIERSYSLVTVTPVVSGPFVFNIYNGHDGKSTLRSSPTGNLHVAVTGLKPAAAK